MNILKQKLISIAILFLTLPLFAGADYGGQKTVFSVDAAYDISKRTSVTATLVRITPLLYFYLEDIWWNGLGEEEQSELKVVLQELGEEFENNIYPVLTKNFGSEWKPGIDKDEHITILISPILKDAGGYINTGNEYSRLQVPDSNEREMIYLNSDYISGSLAKSFLAHEMVHLITFNQKDRIFGVSEEVWLNEARAEYAPTLLGYDKEYQGSNLQRRVREFLRNPNNALAEWKNEKADYGILNLFFQYLVDYYGVKILSDSIFIKQTGISSINEALVKNGFSQDFAQIFRDWTIAVFLNDCAVAEEFCYLNPDLKNFGVSPQINILPLSGKSVLSVAPSAKDWSGNWYKFIGGGGRELKIEFIGSSDSSFNVSYLIQDSGGKWSVHYLQLNKYQQGKIIVPEFGTKSVSLVIVPFTQNKLSGFGGNEKSYPFFWSASIGEELEELEELNEPIETELPQTETVEDDIQTLLKKMEFLEKQLEVLRAKLKETLSGNAVSNGEIATTTVESLDFDLRFGDRGDKVKLLQTWLAKDENVYPEGLKTGYFGPLTQKAVIRFQEKYKQEILNPWNLVYGTGFVGTTTRTKLNALYGAIQ